MDTQPPPGMRGRISHLSASAYGEVFVYVNGLPYSIQRALGCIESLSDPEVTLAVGAKLDVHVPRFVSSPPPLRFFEVFMSSDDGPSSQPLAHAEAVGNADGVKFAMTEPDTPAREFLDRLGAGSPMSVYLASAPGTRLLIQADGGPYMNSAELRHLVRLAVTRNFRISIASEGDTIVRVCVATD